MLVKNSIIVGSHKNMNINKIPIYGKILKK